MDTSPPCPKEIDVIIVSKDERKRTSFQQEIDNMLNRQIEKYVITASEKK